MVIHVCILSPRGIKLQNSARICKNKKMPQQVQLAVAEEMLQASIGPCSYGKRSMIPGGSDMRMV